MCSAVLPGVKVTENFPVNSISVVTARVAINYSRSNFSLKGIFELKLGVNSTLRLKIYVEFTTS